MPPRLERLLALARVDFPLQRRQPNSRRLLVASLVSIVGSLVADALIIAVGTVIFPSTRGYPHFRFADYATLTVIGVLIACVGWPIVNAVSSTARWLFFRLAILVTLVLFLPDTYLLLVGSPLDAVVVLMTMHIAIALVTYNALVRLSPPERPNALQRLAGLGRRQLVRR